MTYVDTINTGAVPCLENAVTTLAQLETQLGECRKAAEHYSERMAQRLRLPTGTLQELLGAQPVRGSHCHLHGQLLQGQDQELEVCGNLSSYLPSPPPALNKKPSSALMVPMVHPHSRMT